MKHRILTLFFCTALAALTCCLPAKAAPVTGTCGEGIEWTYEDGTLTVSGNGEMENFEDKAPWDDYRESITKVVIADGITHVGDNAFRNYDAITEVELGTTLVTLGKGSFLSCDSLERLHLPKSFRIFDEECLRDCKKLTAIHCEGGFPSFRLNCLWGSNVKIYYPASRPWPVSLIQELEEAFHGRIEFLDSDGNDPYVPGEPATEPAMEPTTQPTTEPTTQPTTQPTTAPTTLPPETVPTEPVTVPTTLPPETTQPATETTFPYTMPTEAPREEPRRSGAVVGYALIGLVLSGTGLGILFFNRPKKGGKYSR